MVDVAIAAGLLALVVSLAMQVVVALSSSAEGALVRANARRQVLAARTLLERDAGGARPCAPSGLGPAFVSLNDTATLGKPSAMWFSDVDGDSDVDLVAWRLRAGLLQRAVRLTTPTTSDPCLTTLGSASWETVAPAARARCTLAFAGVAPSTTAAGAPVATATPTPPGTCPSDAGAFSGVCTTAPTSCRFAALAVNVVLEPPGAARAHLDSRYDLPGALR